MIQDSLAKKTKTRTKFAEESEGDATFDGKN